MSGQSPKAALVPPPRFATWMLKLCARSELDAILGDLQEEFTAIANRDGRARGRRWYWHQSVRTGFRLALQPFLDHPGRAILIGLGALLLRFVISVALLFIAIQLPRAVTHVLFVSPREAGIGIQRVDLLVIPVAAWLLARYSRFFGPLSIAMAITAGSLFVFVFVAVTSGTQDPRPRNHAAH